MKPRIIIPADKAWDRVDEVMYNLLNQQPMSGNWWVFAENIDADTSVELDFGSVWPAFVVYKDGEEIKRVKITQETCEQTALLLYGKYIRYKGGFLNERQS